MSANEFGKIFKRAWGDTDFKRLDVAEQHLYFKLISQPDVSLAGVLTYAPPRWAMQTADLGVDDIERAFAGLCARNYAVVDLDTQEVLIRSYIRNDLGWRSPRTMVGVANAVGRVLSPVLRGVISRELTRLDTSTLSGVINEKTNRSTREVVESAIRGVLDEFPPLDTVSGNTVSHTLSDTVSDTVSAVRARNSNGNSNNNGSSRSNSSSNLSCSSDADASSARMKIEQDFADWYQAYPRKRGKADALKAYRAARKAKVSHQTLVDALAAQLPEFARRNIDHVPYPATWIRDASWEDEIEPQHTAGGSIDPLLDEHGRYRDIPAHPVNPERWEDETA